MATKPEQDEADIETGVDGTPKGQAGRWKAEFRFAREKLSAWHRRGKAAVDRYRDERAESDMASNAQSKPSRLNVYAANVQTMLAIMYGKTPRVDVSRRFADSADDVARVSAEILERLLNADIQKDGDTYADAMGSVLFDRLVPGGGVPRVRYVADLEEEAVEPEPADLKNYAAPLAPDEEPQAVPEMDGEAAPEAQLNKAYECVEVDYIHWRDFLYGVGRTWADTRWVAFASNVNRKEAEAQFGKDVADSLPWDGGRGKGKAKATRTEEGTTEKRGPWQQVRIWEVWSREDRRRYFYCEGHPEVLVPLGQDANEDGGVEDPYGLDGFFPCAKPFFANVSTDDFVPNPDFFLHQDLLNQIDALFTRIRLLEDALALRGIYDKSKPAVAQLLTQTGNMLNELLPVEGRQMMDGKGLDAWIQWLPIEMVAAVLEKLYAALDRKIGEYDQVSGMSDLVRGEAAQGATATEQSIKARFASVRIQSLQDEFARVCSDVQRLKAELISKHYEPETLLEAANMAYTPDAQDPQLIQQAIALIKKNHFAFRIEVKPESVSLADYAALKSESMEVIQAIGGYMQMAAPLAQTAPQLGPALLHILSWSISRIRGSQEIEGVIDRAISQMEAQQQQAQQQAASQPKQPPPPDPKVMAVQAKSQADMQHTQAELRADLVRTQAETQAAAQQEANKARIGLAADAAKQRQQVLGAIGNALNPPGTGGV